jgi:nucleotide-binding universal stress UspA family protein
MNAMEDKLVTVAIHTYERALILKGILESEGIETYLHNVNLIQPVISSGVRVRIKESDLPSALKIIEGLVFTDDFVQDDKNSVQNKIILVPIDFSEYSIKAARFAFNLADNFNASITFLHTFYSPIYSGGMPITDAFAFDETNAEELRKLRKKMHVDMDELSDRIKKEIKDGKLPDIKFNTEFSEGVPEEQILLYSKKNKPCIIIMGTKGKGSKDGQFMGSVTSDIIDRSNVPVFAFPVDTPYESFDDIKRIGFITNFEQRDLVAFNSMVDFLSGFSYKVYFIHLSNDLDQWDEIQIAGVKEYFKRQYPNLESSYCVINGDNLIFNLNNFISERKLDTIVLNSRKRNIFSRLFNPSIANKVLFHTETPMFVFKG